MPHLRSGVLGCPRWGVPVVQSAHVQRVLGRSSGVPSQSATAAGVPGLCQRGSATQRHLTEPAPAIDRGKVVADDSIAHLRSLLALPTLEAIFAQLAVEQDTAAVSREIADLIARR